MCAQNGLDRAVISDPSCVRLQQIPGVGPLVSTAVVSAIGNGAAFKKGRDFAAWLGLARPSCWVSREPAEARNDENTVKRRA